MDFDALASPDIAYGRLWKRGAALMIDQALVLLAVLAATVAATIPLAGALSPYPSGWRELAVRLLALAAAALYFARMESSWRQATVGKRVMHLFVTDRQGNRLSLRHALLREGFRWTLLGGAFLLPVVGPVAGPLVALAGCLIAALSLRKQALHDIVAQTLVFEEPSLVT